MFQTHDFGRVFGVKLQVHGSVFLLLAVMVGLALIGQGVAAALGTALLLAAVLGSVTLHELGHIAMARLFGNQTHGITLYPFGGVAQLARESRGPAEETLVALAGPAVNVGLAAATALPLFALGPLLGPLAAPLSTFFWVNVSLALFNLVPAYPMDGGRVVRGLLWSRAGRFKATWWAARAGQVFAALFAVWGLVSNPMLLMIAAFVFFQASAELSRLRAQGPGWDDRVVAPSSVGVGLNQPRPWAQPRVAGDPFDALRRAAVRTVHTPFGTFQEYHLADGRLVRRQVA